MDCMSSSKLVLCVVQDSYPERFNMEWRRHVVEGKGAEFQEESNERGCLEA